MKLQIVHQLEGQIVDESVQYSSEDHIEAVRKQIEYYFSKENLQNDPYLASQMDANKSVPLATIMRVSHYFIL